MALYLLYTHKKKLEVSVKVHTSVLYDYWFRSSWEVPAGSGSFTGPSIDSSLWAWVVHWLRPIDVMQCLIIDGCFAFHFITFCTSLFSGFSVQESCTLQCGSFITSRNGCLTHLIVLTERFTDAKNAFQQMPHFHHILIQKEYQQQVLQ
jgi:hypothetical protein